MCTAVRTVEMKVQLLKDKLDTIPEVEVSVSVEDNVKLSTLDDALLEFHVEEIQEHLYYQEPGSFLYNVKLKLFFSADDTFLF